MSGHMKILTPDKVIDLDLSSPPSLEEMQQAVGGYITKVPYFDTIRTQGAVHACVAFCDEEGEPKGSLRNFAATTLWTLARSRNGAGKFSFPPLLGNVIILWGDDHFMGSL